jgi:hypothetical protein
MSDHGKKHATLSPSSAERWIECPATVRLTASLDRGDDGSSEYAEEGTRAHTLAEMEAALFFGLITQKDHRVRRTAWLKTAEQHGDDVEEMERHVRVYVSLLSDIMAGMEAGTTIYLERRLQTGVPGCWGTGDAVLVSPDVIRIVDFKYGQGVSVYAEDNPQLRLYGLGALEMFDGVLGDAETVGMTICQPRTGSITHEFMDANDLRDWREKVVLPAARETQHPDARFGPSETACRWCPAAGVCKPRMQHIAERDFGNPNLLDPAGLADAFRSLSEIRDWCAAVEKEALFQAYSESVPLPGLKIILAGGKRSIPDPHSAIEVLVAAGFKREQVSRESMKTLGDLERLVGKNRLPEVLGDLLVKGRGNPALVNENDPRPAIDLISEAAAEFSQEA